MSLASELELDIQFGPEEAIPACAGYGKPDAFFFPFVPSELAEVLTLCHACPIRDACYRAGVRGKYEGIWGGEILRLSSKSMVPYLTEALADIDVQLAARGWAELPESPPDSSHKEIQGRKSKGGEEAETENVPTRLSPRELVTAAA